jgi:hypothetical protein
VKRRQVDINEEILGRKINLEMFGKMNISDLCAQR